MTRVIFVFNLLVLINLSNAQSNYTCSLDSECSISCEYGSSSNCPTNIDGISATYLNINCTGNICQNRNIKCPNAGCSINCIGDYACQGTKIQYVGNLNDKGDIYINCEGSQNTCYDMTINAEYIDNIDITCTSLSTAASYGPCNYTLNADYANNVTINNNERWASHGDTWNVQNANSVTLNVRGYCM